MPLDPPIRLETVPCTWCGKPTPMTATRLCDGCWELDRRIRFNPELAQRILNRIELEQIEAHEPPCTCTRLAPDYDDVGSCELCNPESNYNRSRRRFMEEPHAA